MSETDCEQHLSDITSVLKFDDNLKLFSWNLPKTLVKGLIVLSHVPVFFLCFSLKHRLFLCVLYE